jgi:phosphatidylglycerophosphatase A
VLQSLPIVQQLALALLAFALGIWCTGKTATELGVADHGGIVWDEMVAVWLMLAVLPVRFDVQFGAIVLFRLFDIVKPWPIRLADQKVKGGFGVMLDDLLAALAAVALVGVWVW